MALPHPGHLKRSLGSRFTTDHGSLSIGTYLISHDGRHVLQDRKASVSSPPTGSSMDGSISTDPREPQTMSDHRRIGRVRRGGGRRLCRDGCGGLRIRSGRRGHRRRRLKGNPRRVIPFAVEGRPIRGQCARMEHYAVFRVGFLIFARNDGPRSPKRSSRTSRAREAHQADGRTFV